jgi:hypothetical protein
MTSNAVTLKAIDAALAAKFAGVSIDVGSPAVSTPVTVFLEEPDPEEYPERVFPSVAIKMLSAVPDYAGIVDSEDLVNEELSTDNGQTPPVITTRKRPLPHRIMYSVDTWHKARVSESRDLLSAAIFHKIDPRDYLTVQNIDGTAITVWLFWVGGISGTEEKHVDEIIYHKTLNVVVLAYLSLVEATDTTDLKVATEHNFEVSLRHTYLDSNGTLQVDDSKNVKDVEFRVTDTDVEIIP